MTVLSVTIINLIYKLKNSEILVSKIVGFCHYMQNKARNWCKLVLKVAVKDT